MSKTALTEAMILAWAHEEHAATGRWPTSETGAVRGCDGETWMAVNLALHRGYRGLAGGSSLSKLLGRTKPDLTEALVLAWAVEHHAAFGKWPTQTSGAVRGHDGETWSGIQDALYHGHRGLPGGTTLSQLLGRRQPLAEALILEWVREEHAATGAWPKQKTGAVRGHDGETWDGIDQALRNGARGLPGGSSLAKLLGRKKDNLSEALVIAWAREHHGRTGKWPTAESGPVHGHDGETWCGIQHALRDGCRGLPGGSSLPQLLAPLRGTRR